MLILTDLPELKRLKGPVHLAIGVFDGVHLGHQAVIREAVQGARESGGSAAVLTFDPHPVKILNPQKAPRLLTSTRHKIKFMAELGADAVFIQKFDSNFAQTAPADFVQSLVHACDPLQQICVGEGWTFGARRSGTVDLLRQLGQKFSFQLSSVAPVLGDNVPISSTLIRSAVEQGDLLLAAEFLGRKFSILGTVSEGTQLGRKLGFPTANLAAHNEQFPPDGVYAAAAWYEDQEYGGVVNIGTRPTVAVKGGERLLELHLFDFKREIYGEDVEVAFLAYLRPEQKFRDLAALQGQIRIDSAKARAIYRKFRSQSQLS